MIDIIRRAMGIVAAVAVVSIVPLPAWAQQNAPGQADQAAAEQASANPPEPQPEAVDARYATPQATMFVYLQAMTDYQKLHRPEDMQKALSAFDFSAVSLPATQREIAAELLNILNRINTVAAWQFPAVEGDRFVYFPQDWISAHKRVAALAPHAKIALERQDDGRWVFDQETVENIPEFFHQVENLPAQFGEGEVALTPAMLIRARMPDVLRHGEFIGIEYWQWLALAILILLGFIVDQIVRGILRASWHRIERRRGQETPKDLLAKAVRPFGMFAGALIWCWLLQLVGLPPTAANVLLIAIKVVLMLSGVWAAYRVTDLAADFLERQAGRSNTKLDDLLIPLGRKTGKVLVTAFGLIYIAESLNIEVLPLLTGLGIGGLAFAFAAKDTIENFFGSVAVILDQPFEVGDWVKIDDTEGTVEELGLRSTRIRTSYNSQITVPNATLVRATVDNYGRRRYRRFTSDIGVTYSTTPEQIEAFCEGIREIVRMHPYTRKDYYHVYLNSWGDFSLNILLYVFFDCPDWSVELRERHRLMLDIMRLAEQLGVEFALPTQTLEVRTLPEEREARPRIGSNSEASKAGIEAAHGVTRNADWKQSKPGPVEF